MELGNETIRTGARQIVGLLVSLILACSAVQARENDRPGRDRTPVHAGMRLFNNATFGGNGRTCVTCHGLVSGTISPEEVQARFTADGLARGAATPLRHADSLFRSIDSDDGVGDEYTRLLARATIRVGLNLPSYVTLADDLSARSIVVNRGIPSTVNSSLITPLMLDGRASDLETQALGAVMGHYEPTRLPSLSELRRIADFERGMFSRPELAAYARGGSPPELPQGNTEQERRGRAHFEPSGMCGSCHGGPMLDETTDAHIVRAGLRFENAGVSERNALRNPVYAFLFETADGTIEPWNSPDPGLALITRDHPYGDPAYGLPMNFFRIPTLWNIRNTAPYFHDNSALTLEEVVAHYTSYLSGLGPQTRADILAYLELL